MKKILLFLFIIISILCKAQRPTWYTGISSSSYEWTQPSTFSEPLGLPAKNGFPSFHTKSWKRAGTFLYDSLNKQAYIWNGTIWQPFGAQSNNSNSHTGCAVTWASDSLSYAVNLPCSYSIGSRTFTLTSPDTVRLDPGTASAGQFRHDGLAVDTNYNFVAIKGNNSTGGIVNFPIEDQQSQHLLTYVRIDETSQVNTQVSERILYDEQSVGEATISKTVTSTDGYTIIPFHLTKSARITTAAAGAYWRLTVLDTLHATNSVLVFGFKNKGAAMLPAKNVVVLKRFKGVLSGVNASFTNWGLSKTDTNWQELKIPLSALAGGDNFDAIEIVFSGAGAVDNQIDYVRIQSGLVQTVTNGNPVIDIFKNGTDSVFQRRLDGTVEYRFFDKDGNGFNILDSAYKTDIARKPWIYGYQLKALGNSWVTGAFGGGTNWFSQLCTYYGKAFTNYGVSGDDSRGVVRYGYQNISGNSDSSIYFVDAAWVDIAGVTPASPAYLGGVYGYNDNAKSFKKVQGLYRALFANYYLDTYSFFEDLTPASGSFATQTTTDSTRSKATVASKHIMKGQGTYTFVKPKNQQSLAIGYLNTDGIVITGGTINVYLRGKLYKTVNTNNSNNSGQGAGGAPPSLYMGLSYDAIVMHNLPQDTCTITVETTTADVWLDYYGYIVPPNKTEKPIYVNSLPYLTGTVSPLVDFNNSRSKVDSFNLARKQMIQESFENYPVFIVDINSTITAADYTAPTANSHLAASGNNKVADYYKRNLIPTYNRYGSDYLVEGSGGSGSTLFDLSGTNTATGNVTGDLDGNDLRIEDGADNYSTFNATSIYHTRNDGSFSTGFNQDAERFSFTSINAAETVENIFTLSQDGGLFTIGTDKSFFVDAGAFGFLIDRNAGSWLLGANSVIGGDADSIKITLNNSGVFAFTADYSADNDCDLCIPSIVQVKSFISDSISGIGGGDVYLANNQTFTGTNQFNKNITIGQSSYTAGMPTQLIINYDGSGGYGTRGIMLNDKWSGGTGVMQLIGGSSTFYFTNGSGTPSKISAAGYQNGSTGNSIDFGGSGVNVNGDRFAIGGINYTSAIFQIASTTKYSIPAPPMTDSQKGSLTSLTAGATIYCTDCTASDASTGVTQTYNGSTWKNHW